jgi:hypothetical protein
MTGVVRVLHIPQSKFMICVIRARPDRLFAPWRTKRLEPTSPYG